MRKDWFIPVLPSKTEDAKWWIDVLRSYVSRFAIGHYMATAVGLPQAVRFIRAFGGSDVEIFYDGRLNGDLIQVVEAVREAVRLGIAMISICGWSDDSLLRQAKYAVAESTPTNGASSVKIQPMLLGATLFAAPVDAKVAADWFGVEPSQSVASRVTNERLGKNFGARAKDFNLDGLVVSTQEIVPIRIHCGPKFIIVASDAGHSWFKGDYVRPADALRAGADYVILSLPQGELSRDRRIQTLKFFEWMLDEAKR